MTKKFGSITIGRIKAKFSAPKFVHSMGHTFLNPHKRELVVVDFGGNFGNFAEEVLKKYNVSRYVCVEPDDVLVEGLRKRLRRFKQVEIENFAVGLDEKDVCFFVAKATAANSVLKDFALKQGIVREVKVDSYSLDSFLRMFGLDSVDWLKVDIEGSEWNLILGASDESLLKCKQISVEFHNMLDVWNKDYFYDTQRVIERLYLLGFRYYVKSEDYSDVLFVKER